MATILSASTTELVVKTPVIIGDTVAAKVAVRGSELWSNEVDIVFLPLEPEVIDDEKPKSPELTAKPESKEEPTVEKAQQVVPLQTNLAQIIIYLLLLSAATFYLYKSSSKGQSLKTFKISHIKLNISAWFNKVITKFKEVNFSVYAQKISLILVHVEENFLNLVEHEYQRPLIYIYIQIDGFGSWVIIEVSQH